VILYRPQTSALEYGAIRPALACQVPPHRPKILGPSLFFDLFHAVFAFQ
jgi:hypothetical protein